MCEYCEKQYGNKPLADSRLGDMEIEAGDIVAGDFGAEIARARINFCPMCARDLRGNLKQEIKKNGND